MGRRTRSCILLIALVLVMGVVPGRGALGRPAERSAPAASDWPQFHFDARNSGYNPYERILSPSNVGSLREAWAASTSSTIAPDPVVWGGKVYVAPTDGIIRAFDASTGNLIWATDTQSEIEGVAPAVADGVVYVGTGQGVLWALDASTGGLIWSKQLGDSIYFPVSVAGGVLYVNVFTNGGANTLTEAMDAASGNVLWSSTLFADSAPAVGDGMVYMASTLGSTIWALSAATGKLVWFRDYGDEFEPHSSVAVVGRLILFVMDGLHAVDAFTGTTLWTRNTFSVSTPAAAYGRVFVQTSTGQELLAGKDDGTPIWSAQLPAAAMSSLAVANGVVYVGCDDETLRAYDASNGRELWQSRQLDSQVEGSPAVAGGMLYATTANGSVWAFALP